MIRFYLELYGMAIVFKYCIQLVDLVILLKLEMLVMEVVLGLHGVQVYG